MNGLKQKNIATWLYLEGIDENGTYPQVKGKSYTPKFHDIYKNCLVTFFLSAKKSNPDAAFFLFCNIDLISSTREIDVSLMTLFRELDVKFINLQFTFQPPEEQRKWRNQFYVLDILKYFSYEMNEKSSCVILDGDVIWSSAPATSKLWNELTEIGYLNMLPIKERDEVINGLSLDELAKLSRRLGNLNVDIQYAGGEFIALRGDYLKKVFQRSSYYWEAYKRYLLTSDSALIEEAHFLSIVYSSLGMKYGEGDKYIRRIWTQVFHYSNRQPRDIDLVCWHLPAEKRFGIRRTAQRFLNEGNEWPSFESKHWQRMVRELALTRNSGRKILQDLSISIKDRISEICK